MTLTDKSLALMGAPWHIGKLTGQDRADVFEFARFVAHAERVRIIDSIGELCTTPHESKEDFIWRVKARLAVLRKAGGT